MNGEYSGNPFKKTKKNFLGIPTRSFGVGIFDMFSDSIVFDYSKVLGVCFARKYLTEYKDPEIAWRKSRYERDNNPKFSEELRNSEHYLYAYYAVNQGIHSWISMVIFTYGYHTYKFYSHVLGHYVSLYKDLFRGSMVTFDELASGFAGAHDAVMGYDNDECECQ